jgi:porin
MPPERWPRAAEIRTRRSTVPHGRTLWRTPARPILLLALLGSGSSIQAYDLTGWLSVGGVVAAGGQCQILANGSGVDDECGGALPIQTQMSLRPNESDELFVKLGFAAGEGLNEDSPFALAPWAADLQGDVTDINGRWSHLLGAWYAHRFTLGKNVSLRATGGVIDSTDYLDDNVYSNDEYTQFMNEALVNGPNAFLPSYDFGGALELDVGPWSARGVAMQIGENGDGNSFTFWGAQLGYRAETPWGVGNYRVLVVGTGDDFLDPRATSEESRFAVGLSFDQQLGETFGAFLRLAWQADDAAIAYDSIYSGGINIRGGAWRRPEDEIGLAYGYLLGGNESLRGTHVAELYYRFAAWKYLAITADVQYMRDDFRIGRGPRGIILGLRFTSEF